MGTSILAKTLQMAEVKKIILEIGGSRSSKTWSIFQFFIINALQGKNWDITIARKVFKDTKGTLLKDFQTLIEKYKLDVTPEINFNRADQIYSLNGSTFEFFGLDNSGKLHGKSQDWFWLNETIEIERKHFDQLEMRTRIGAILDLNPSDDTHWVFDLEKRPDVGAIHSTMLDNPFLEQVIVDKIKSYEPNDINYTNGTADLYMWEVYGLGKKAKLQGAIFENWDIVDTIPTTSNLIGYGLDFGYTNDPTALVAVYIQDNELYLEELLYETKLVNEHIAEKMRICDVKSDDIIIADSSEPKSIEEIARSGFSRITGVEKGQDSVKFGIDLMHKYKIHITKRSSNLESELRKYKWSEDRNGNNTNKPVDAYNHAIDATRYVVMDQLKKKHETILYAYGSIV